MAGRFLAAVYRSQQITPKHASDHESCKRKDSLIDLCLLPLRYCKSPASSAATLAAEVGSLVVIFVQVVVSMLAENSPLALIPKLASFAESGSVIPVSADRSAEFQPTGSVV